MKIRATPEFVLLLASCWTACNAFVASPRPWTVGQQTPTATTILFSTTEEEKKTTEAPVSRAVDGDNKEEPVVDPDAEGLPWWWELVWKLDVMQKGVEGNPITFGDTANVLRTNIEQIYGGYPSLDGCPLAGEFDWCTLFVRRPA